MATAVPAPRAEPDELPISGPLATAALGLGDWALFARRAVTGAIAKAYSARELLRPTLLATETFAAFTTTQFPTLAGVLPDVGRFAPNPWGLGVEIRATKEPHWTGRTNSPDTFGHFGGTGTFLWVDPRVDRALVCLTDREFGPWALSAWPALSDAALASDR